MGQTITVLAITPEGDEAYLAPINKISGVSLQVSTHPREEQFEQCQLIILFAGNGSTIVKWLVQIRGRISLSLLPVLVISPEVSLGPYQLLADDVFYLPLDIAQIKAKLDRMQKLYEQVSTLPPLIEQLTPYDAKQCNLLRYLITRELKILSPQRFLNYKLGYAYPLAAGFLNTPLGEELSCLQELEQLGLLQGKSHDRLHICPKCEHYQLNFREVCPKCQLPLISREENFHHYACSYIAPESEFLKDRQLMCPKCKKALRHIGVDYDKPSISYNCQNCGHNFPEPVVNCLCINCGHVFFPRQARLIEVKEYQITLAGIRSARAGAINIIPGQFVRETASETIGYNVFEEMFRVQLWISKRLQRSFCLIGMEMEGAEDVFNDKISFQDTRRLDSFLMNNLRGNDIISRVNTGQFLILSPETDREKASVAVQRITSKIDQICKGRTKLKVAIAQLPKAGEDLKQLVSGLLGSARNTEFIYKAG
jgi:hypothetical protein